MIGRSLGHHRVLEQIGEGGMGVVYRAHDERLDRDVALKVLRPGTLTDEAARKRFRKEALALSRLNHPNIETVHDFDTAGGVDFLVIEYIPGLTLSERVSAGPLPEKEILKLGMQLAEGLAAAHAQHIVHRDLKPGNLRIMPDGRLKILDFGLAKAARPLDDVFSTQSVTGSEAIAGTLPYMAPEQLQGAPVDARADIYASGVVLYEMATGRRPFDARLATALADDILHKDAPPPGRLRPDLSPRLEQVILKCLEKDPENRYQSATELLVDLRRLSAPGPASSRAPAVTGRDRRPLAALAGAVVLAGAMAAALFLNAGGLRDRLFGGPAARPIRSLAVLPLDNLSRDPAQEYFADGMTEAMIADLSKISALRVISRTSVMQYKGVKRSLPEIAQALKVDAVVEGSVLREGDRVRITAQLIAAEPERHVWANTYDRDVRDVLAVHSEVARAIAQEIKIAVRPEEKVRLANARRVDPAAYDAYLTGRNLSSRWTAEGLKKGIEYLQQAIDKDPTFALPYAALASAYASMAYWGHIAPRPIYERAKAAALRAVELDDTLPRGHQALATVHFYYDWDLVAAEREIKRALTLDSNDASAHLAYATFLATARNNPTEAVAEVRRVQALDPASVAIQGKTTTAWIFVFVGDYDQAIRQAQAVLAVDPNYPQAYYVLGVSAIGRARPADAIAPFERAAALSRDSVSLAYLASAYALAGQHAKARVLLDELTDKAKRDYVAPMRFVWVHASMGEANRALEFLDQSLEAREAMLWWLRASPMYAPLRGNPRFLELLRRMNFPSQ